MRFHGQRSDHESLGDVGIAEAAGDELEDLAFPLDQLGPRLAFGLLAEAVMTADASIGFAARGVDKQLIAGDSRTAAEPGARRRPFRPGSV
jgi:hypothetical protein